MAKMFPKYLTQVLEETILTAWADFHLQVPKNLFEPTDRDYLTSLNRESGLQLTEKLLKKIEQCLDMVAREMDMNEETSEFAELFKVSRDFSKAAATEVEIAMEELEVIVIT